MTPEPPGRATLSVSGSGVTVTGSDAIIPPSTASLSLSFHCHVENSQAVSYLWMSNGVVIGSGYERDTLNLTTSEPGNVIGSYQCVASNVAGQVSSTAIRVLISKLSSIGCVCLCVPLHCSQASLTCTIFACMCKSNNELTQKNGAERLGN